jgi:hypothetical protein
VALLATQTEISVAICEFILFYAHPAELKRNGRTIPREESRSIACAVESGISQIWAVGSFFGTASKKVSTQSLQPISRTAQESQVIIMIETVLPTTDIILVYR